MEAYLNSNSKTLSISSNVPQSNVEEFDEKLENQEEISELDITITRENSEIDTSIIERNISNASVVFIEAFKKDTKSFALSKMKYFEDSIEYLKRTNPELNIDYTKSKNFVSKESLGKNDVKPNKRINSKRRKANNMIKYKISEDKKRIQYKLVDKKRIGKNGNFVLATYIGTDKRYHIRFFPLKGIISSDNTEKNCVISKDKKEGIETKQTYSNKKKEEDQIIEEPEDEEVNQINNEYNSYKNKKYHGYEKYGNYNANHRKNENYKNHGNYMNNENRNYYENYGYNYKRNNYYRTNNYFGKYSTNYYDRPDCKYNKKFFKYDY